MSLDRDTEKNALMTLVQSEGWRILCQQFGEDWGDTAIVTRMRAAVSKVALGDEAAQEDAVSRILACRDGVEAFMSYPVARIRALEAAVPTTEARPVRARA